MCGFPNHLVEARIEAERLLRMMEQARQESRDGQERSTPNIAYAEPSTKCIQCGRPDSATERHHLTCDGCGAPLVKCGVKP